MRNPISGESPQSNPEGLHAAQRQRRRWGGTLFGSSIAVAALHFFFAGFVSLLMFVSVPFAEYDDPASSPLNEKFHWLWNLIFVPWLPVVLILLAGILGYRSVVKSVNFHGMATYHSGLAVASSPAMFYVSSVLGDAVGGMLGVLHGITVVLLLADALITVLAVRLWWFTNRLRRDAYSQIGSGS